MSWFRENYKLILILILVLIIPEIYLYPLFLLVIKPAGEKEINEILFQVNKTNNTFEKLEIIAEWETRNFTNTYNKWPTFTLDPLFRYPIYYDGSIKVRASAPLLPELSNNPYWIAFFKDGACGELAALFSDVATKAGLETRIVRTEGEDHTWVEVKINGTWTHVDPTLFYINRYYNRNIRWIDNPRYYDICWFDVSKVFVMETNEDITEKYTDIGVLIVNLMKPADRITIKTMKKGKERLVTVLDINTSTIRVELGGKKYIVTAERDLVPNFVVLQGTKGVEVVEGKQTVIELSPTNIGFKLPFYLSLLLLAEIVAIFLRLKKKRKETTPTSP